MKFIFSQHIRECLAWTSTLVRPFRKSIVCSALIDLMGMGFSLCSIYFSKKAIDIATGSDSGSLWLNAGLMVGCILGSIISSLSNPWITEKVKLRMQMKLQTQLSDHLMRNSWSSAGQWHTGDIINRMISDCNDVIQLLVYTLPSIAVTTVKLIASFLFLCALDAQLAWILLVSTPLLLFSKLYYKKMRALSKAWKETDSKLLSVMQENMASRILIRSIGAISVRFSKLNEQQEKRYQLGMEQLKFGTYSKSMLQLVFGGGYLTAFLWGIHSLSKNLISFGSMTAFIQLVGRVQGPVLQLISFVPGLIKVQASIERLMELDQGDMEKNRSSRMLYTPTRLGCRNLFFKYEKTELFNGMSLDIQAGEPVAIIGPTGAGKTTFLRLVMGILEPDEGDMYVEEEGRTFPLKDISQKNFVYVPQGNSLFSGTIRENLLLANPKATEEMLKEVIDAACAYFVKELPEGMDTLIGESGYGLSEGQAQRLAIARALLLPGSIWVFDEITSALDSHTAKELIGHLLERGKDKIILFVTHDANLMNECTRKIRIGMHS